MSFSTVTVPANVSVVPVDTRVVRKVLYLPTVSTNQGRFLLFKDYYGTSSNSTFTVSTTGTDLIDDYNYLYTMSNSWGSLSLVSDGLRSWRLMNLYDGALTPAGPSSNLPLIPAARYSFLSTNYSGSGPATNVGSNSAIGTATVSLASYTAANPGYMSLTQGAGHYVLAPSVSAILTLILIVRVTAATGNYYLLDARSGLGNGWIYSPQTGPDWLSNTTYYLNTVLTTLPASGIPQAYEGQGWVHVALVRSVSFTDDVTFCARFSLNENFGGDCAECMIFTQALTAQQVKDNFNFFASRFGWTPVS